VFWLFVLFFSLINASEQKLFEETFEGIMQNLLPVRENIVEYLSKSEKADLKHVSKGLFHAFLDEGRDSYINYVARTNLFNEDFDLNYFQRPNVKVPDDLRKEISEQYKNLMEDPVFFLKFAKFDKVFNIPKYLCKKIKHKKIEVPDTATHLSIFTPLDNNNQEIQMSNCIIIADQLSKKEFESCLDCINNQQFIRLLIQDIKESQQFEIFLKFDYFKIIEEKNHNDWFIKYIIQYISNANTKFHTMKNTLQGVESIKKDILLVKNSQCQTPLFFQPVDTIRLDPKIYINEYDDTLCSALFVLMLRMEIEITNQEMIYIIKVLIKKGIRLDNRNTKWGWNPVFLAIRWNSITILKELSKGKNFYQALHNSVNYENNLTSAFQFAQERSYINKEIIDFLGEWEQTKKEKIISYAKKGINAYLNGSISIFVIKWGLAAFLALVLIEMIKDKFYPYPYPLTMPRLLRSFLMNNYRYGGEKNISFFPQLWFLQMRGLFSFRSYLYSSRRIEAHPLFSRHMKNNRKFI